jgi:monovalent cation:H+ antiporter-2, CPA2 family
MAGELQTEGLSNALVILGAAGVVIPAFARVRINPIVGFLLVGVLVGPFGLGSLAAQFPWLRWITISDIEEISPLGDYGIILLLFTIGLELSFRRLWKMRRMVFVLGPAELFTSSLLIALGLSFLDYSWGSSVGLGLALALSSTALVVPIAGTQSAVGRRALGMLLFEDLAIVPIIFILGALAPQSTGGSWNGLLTVLSEGALVVGLMLILGRFFLPYLFGQAARTKSPELFLAASLLVVIIASLATSAVGLSPIFGALIAGLLIAETDYRHEVEIITAPFKGLALGVFRDADRSQFHSRKLVDASGSCNRHNPCKSVCYRRPFENRWCTNGDCDGNRPADVQPVGNNADCFGGCQCSSVDQCRNRYILAGGHRDWLNDHTDSRSCWP